MKVKSRYYKIERDHRPKVVGVRDGGAQAELFKKSFTNKEKYDEYVNYFLSYKGEWFYNQTKFPPSDFDFEYVKLRKSAFLTDFVYFAPSFYHRYLLSERVRELLNDFYLPSFKYYRTKLYSNNEFTDEYSFFYCPSFNYDYVEFKSCHFSIGNSISGKKYFEVQSKAQFLEVREPVNIEKIVLKDIDPTFDYFNALISPEPFISERLKDKLIEKKITGITIVELDESKFSII